MHQLISQEPLQLEVDVIEDYQQLAAYIYWLLHVYI